MIPLHGLLSLISKNVTSYLLQDRKFPLVTFSSIESFSVEGFQLKKKIQRYLNIARHFDLVGNLLSQRWQVKAFGKNTTRRNRRVEIFSKTSRRKIGIDSGPGLARVGPWALSWP